MSNVEIVVNGKSFDVVTFEHLPRIGEKVSMRNGLIADVIMIIHAPAPTTGVVGRTYVVCESCA